MNRVFVELFVRNQPLFEEAAAAFEEHPADGLALLDAIVEDLDLEGELEALAESYVRGELDPFA